MTDPTANRSEIRPAYRPDIDGLRAVAIVSVVLFHVSGDWLPGGFVGVDIFFVISGFLISSLIFKELEQGHFSFGDFYIRRVRRIFPALLAMMLAVWIAALFLFTGGEFMQLGAHILAGGAFAANLLQWREAGYFDTNAALKPLQHLWSLGIEEQFYILWPVTLVLLWRWKAGLRAAILLGLLLSFGFNIWRTPLHAVGAFYLPFGRAWELLLGALLAWQERQGRGPLLTGNPAAGLGLALLAVGFAAINSESEFPGWWVLLPTFGAMFLIAAGPQAWINRRLLAHPAMVFVGLISYPLYIWHWPLLSLLRIVGNAEPSLREKLGAVALAVLLAVVTYYGLERPLRTSRLPRKAIVGVLASAMAAMCLAGYLSDAGILRTPGMVADEMAIAARRGAWNRVSDCQSFLSPRDPNYLGCRIWGDPALKKTFVIWGDSHANSWSGAAAAIAKERGARLVELSTVACPPILAVRRLVPHLHHGEACNDIGFADSTMRIIAGLKPAETILASRWSLYLNDYHALGMDNSFITADPTGATTLQTSLAAMQTQIPVTVKKLAGFGKVLIIEAVPTLHSSIEVGLARDPKGYEPSLAEYRALEAAPNAIAQKLARDIPGVSLLDPAAVLCDARKCHAFKGGVRVYEDDVTHLSDAGAMLFMPALRKLIK